MKSHQEFPSPTGNENPFELFKQWHRYAIDFASLREPNAMFLATANQEGPHGRVVLLKEITSEGFVFYTNYESPKGKQIAQNSQVALTFYWDAIALQVRIEGPCSKIPAEVSDIYWKSRPRESQLSQWVSHQSEPVDARKNLELCVSEAEQKFLNQPIPRPEHWGGYLVKPTCFEFWVGRSHRLHDRFLFLDQSGQWQAHRLQP
ncbi:MAG: pyridoxamine 5'-phosphate oxidase [Bdellovibrionales bacterium]|nr:pyridoxamine 5'-phosphate oxidase [Bdellovibrionales bacterium]